MPRPSLILLRCFLSETENPPGGDTLLFASVRIGRGDARAWQAWEIGGDGQSLVEGVLPSGGQAAEAGLAGTRDRGLQRRPGVVLSVRIGRERTTYGWNGRGLVER